MAAQTSAHLKSGRISRKTRSQAAAPSPSPNEVTSARITQIGPARTDLIPQSVRQDMIAEAAYYLAERRGFQPGHEAEDWLQAEAEIDEIITRRYTY